MKGRKIKSLPYIKFSEDKDDPYRIDKRPDGAYCEQCGIVYIDKNWKLKAIEREKKVPIICPACRKINDKYYMGVLTISGEFLKEHKDEIINLIKNEEKKLRSKNSLPRIALIEELNGAIVVNTTSV
jgi:NMD protein affecting ribosome stability and mRNA decay